MLQYECKYFDQLHIYELYEIMRLRQEVFIIEQNCAYLDADGIDLISWHITGRDSDGELLAYTRLIPEGEVYSGFVSIGRVINSKKVRGTGEGERLMQYAVSNIMKIYPDRPIKISAQSYLLKFYNKFGFVESGDEYLEDNIPHTAMIKQISMHGK